jgi:uncharacterized phage infection (PIP) family protein YhgE
VADTATQVKEQSTAVATEAGQATKEVAGAAKEQAATVMQDAREEVSHVASEAKAQAQSLMNDTRQQLRAQADEQATKVAGSLRQLSDELRAISEGRTEEAGTVGNYLRDAGSQLEQFASRIDTQGVEGIVGDMQRFARRRPAAFLLGAAGAGFLAGRLFRSMKDDQSSGSSSMSGMSGMSNGAMPSPTPTTPEMTAGLTTGLSTAPATSFEEIGTPPTIDLPELDAGPTGSDLR